MALGWSASALGFALRIPIGFGIRYRTSSSRGRSVVVAPNWLRRTGTLDHYLGALRVRRRPQNAGVPTRQTRWRATVPRRPPSKRVQPTDGVAADDAPHDIAVRCSGSHFLAGVALATWRRSGDPGDRPLVPLITRSGPHSRVNGGRFSRFWCGRKSDDIRRIDRCEHRYRHYQRSQYL
jgi:hypothetical protein